MYVDPIEVSLILSGNCLFVSMVSNAINGNAGIRRLGKTLHLYI